jgi:hypothetical protein
MEMNAMFQAEEAMQTDFPVLLRASPVWSST